MRNTTDSKKSKSSSKTGNGEEFYDWDIEKIREILY